MHSETTIGGKRVKMKGSKHNVQDIDEEKDESGSEKGKRLNSNASRKKTGKSGAGGMSSFQKALKK